MIDSELIVRSLFDISSAAQQSGTLSTAEHNVCGTAGLLSTVMNFLNEVIQGLNYCTYGRRIPELISWHDMKQLKFLRRLLSSCGTFVALSAAAWSSKLAARSVVEAAFEGDVRETYLGYRVLAFLRTPMRVLFIMMIILYTAVSCDATATL